MHQYEQVQFLPAHFILKLALAGNIVPAIATTNAVIAGLLVMEAYKVLQNRLSDCKMVHCIRTPSVFKRKQCLLYPVSLSKPNEGCYVCSSNFITIKCNTHVTSLEFFVTEILQKQLALQEPLISTDDGRLLFDMGDDLDQGMSSTSKVMLKEFGLDQNGHLVVEDYFQDLKWIIALIHDETLETKDFEIQGKTGAVIRKPPAREESQQQPQEATKQEAVVDDQDDVVLIAPARDKKRVREEQGTEPAAKRQKEQQETIELVD